MGESVIAHQGIGRVAFWRRPDLWADSVRGGWFHTGDRGRFDEQGFLHIVGRNKDMIISGGFNVYPREIELAIDALPGVVESAVIGAPHPDFGEGVVAVIARASGSALGEQQVFDALGARLARVKQPKRVFFVDDLPRNAMGKVQKAALRAQYAGAFRAP